MDYTLDAEPSGTNTDRERELIRTCSSLLAGFYFPAGLAHEKKPLPSPRPLPDIRRRHPLPLPLTSSSRRPARPSPCDVRGSRRRRWVQETQPHTQGCVRRCRAAEFQKRSPAGGSRIPTRIQQRKHRERCPKGPRGSTLHGTAFRSSPGTNRTRPVIIANNEAVRQFPFVD